MKEINWKKVKLGSKILTYIFIIIAIIQWFFIMNQYYQDHKGKDDFWNLKEEYRYNSYEQPPEELVKKTNQLSLFRISMTLIIVFASLFEFSRYKIDPILYKIRSKKTLLGKLTYKIIEGVNKSGED